MTVGAERDKSSSRWQASELAVRVISAIVLAAIALLAVLLGGWVAGFVAALATAVIHLEWVNLTEGSPWPSAVFTGGLVVAVIMLTLGFTAASFMLVGLAVLASAATISVWRPVGVVYASVLGLGTMLLIMSPERGAAAVVVIFATVWATDTGAFFAGRLIGGPRLWPAVSPKKTWAGAIGGFAAGVLAGALVGGFVNVPVGPPMLAVVACLSIASQVGDLFESWVKRRFGAKDSGNIVPGHGGFLDRVDGLIFATGLAVLIGWLHGGAGEIAKGVISW